MANNIQVKRGTRAGLNTLAGSNSILAGQPYLITDEARLAVGLTPSTFSTFTKQGEAPTIANGSITLAKTNLGYVNVLDYGALNNDTGDNSTAFQAAIDTGKSVFVPGGTYRFSSATLQMRNSYQKVVGDNSMPTLSMYSAIPMFNITTTTGAVLNEFPGIENLKIYAGVAPAYTTPSTTNCAILIDGSISTTANAVQRCRIKNVRLLGWGTNIYLKQHVGTVIEDVTIDQYTTWAGTFTTANRCVGIHFDGTPRTTGGISPQASVEVVRFKFSGGGTPANVTRICFNIQGADLRDIFLTDCECATVEYGIWATATSNAFNFDIHINRFIIDAYTQVGMLFQNFFGNGQISINGGYCAGTSNAVYSQIWIENTSGVSVQNFQFVGIGNQTDEGIRMIGATNCSIVGCLFQDMTYGISVTSSSNFNSFCSNTIYGNVSTFEVAPTLSDAIRISGTSLSNTFLGNIIKGGNTTYKYTNGINIGTGCTDNEFHGNKIETTTVATPWVIGDTNNLIIARGTTGNFSTTQQGLVPASPGGTTAFLRADGTWIAAPGTGGIPDGDKGDVVTSAGGVTWIVESLNPASGAVTMGTYAGSAVVAPINIDMGGTYSATPAVGQKLKLFSDNGGTVYGFGVSAAQLDYVAPANAAHSFWIGGTKYGTLSNTAFNMTGNITSTGSMTPNTVLNLLTSGDPASVPGTVGTLKVYASSMAGREYLGMMDATGEKTILQPHIARGNICWWSASAGTATVPAAVGLPTPTSVGTPTARNPAVTNYATRAFRLGFVSVATAGGLCGQYFPVGLFNASSSLGAAGGYHFICRFVVSDPAAVTGARMFVGVSSNIAAPTNVEPSTLTNSIGVAKLAASNNLQIVFGGSAAQAAIDLGVNFPANTLSVDIYELQLYAPNNTTDTVLYRVERINTGNIATGTLTAATAGTQLPNSSALMAPRAWRTNNATALAVSLDVINYYVDLN